MNLKKIAILSAGVVLVALLAYFEPFRFFDNLFYDFNFVFSGLAASDSVVIVAIDSRAIEEVGAMPWPRTTMARLVSTVEACGPRAVAMDFLFPRRDDAAGNDSLAAAFSRAGNLVLPFRADAITMKELSETPVVPRNIFDQRFLMLTNKNKLADCFFYSVVSFSEADTLFTRYAQRGGFLNVSTSSSSQKLREVIHVVRAGNEYYPSFALAAVAEYLGVKADALVLDGSPAVSVGNKRLPLTGYAATAYVNFRSKARPVRSISASDLLSGKVDKSDIAGKLVFIGVTDPMAVADFFSTPVRVQYPGVEVWANAALDILEGTSIIWGGGAWSILGWALVLLIFPGLALLIPGSKKITAIASGIGLLIASVAISAVLFRSYHYYLNPANHVYAWLFSLLWLAALKADPALAVSVPPVELDIPQSDVADQLPPPRERDYIRQVPACPTAAFALKKMLPDQDIAAGASRETVLGTLIEPQVSDIPVPNTSALSAEDLRLVTIPEQALTDFRSMAGGVIIKMLGSGGMADVYLTWQPRLEVYRAVKVLKPGQPSSFLSRFETEIRIFSKLNHPAIVHCYGAGEWHGLPCVEMEYIHGTSVENVLEKKGPLTAAQTAAVGIIICKALSFAHNQVLNLYGQTYNGVVHRDLKPANILLSRSGRVKLADFGIARPGEVSLHTVDAGSVVGTLPYLAPEQLDAAKITPLVDIYALGATLYELLTGVRAFPQTEMTSLIKAKTMGDFKPLLPSGMLPKPMVDAIHRAMATDPAQRFAQAADFGKSLETALSGLVREKAYTHLQDLAKGYWAS